MRTHRSLVVVLAAVGLGVACSRGDRGPAVSFDASASATDMPLGPEDVRVTSTDGALTLSLVGDTVRMQLGDSLRRAVQQQLDTASGDGVGAMITRSVGGIVGSAMRFVASAPVQSIENVRYEDGHIRLESRGDGRSKFSMSGKGNGEDARFTPADGERFVAAVRRRQAAVGARP